MRNEWVLMNVSTCTIYSYDYIFDMASATEMKISSRESQTDNNRTRYKDQIETLIKRKKKSKPNQTTFPEEEKNKSCK